MYTHAGRTRLSCTGSMFVLTKPKSPFLFPLQSMNDSSLDVAHPQAKKKRVGAALVVYHFACPCMTLPLAVASVTGHNALLMKADAVMQSWQHSCGFIFPSVLRCFWFVGLTRFSSAETQLSTIMCGSLCACAFTPKVCSGQAFTTFG